jgi:transcriptional regulator with XRE-family HTH domain
MTTKRNKKSSEKWAAEFGALVFGELLWAYRETEQLTQKELAEKLGITSQKLCDFEKGRRLPSLKQAAKFASTLGEDPATWVQVLLQEEVRKNQLKLKVSVAS